MKVRIHVPNDNQYRPTESAPVNKDHCRAQVYSGDHRMSIFGQCDNAARFFEKHPDYPKLGKLGWCKRHLPSEVAKKEAAKTAAWEARYAAQTRALQRPGRLEKLLKRARSFLISLELTPERRKLVSDIDKELAGD